jgi:IS5 family transposase
MDRLRRRTSSTLATAALSLIAVGAATAASPAQPASTSARHWSGTGNRTLGTIKVTRDAAVRWTSSGRRFELTDRSRKLRIAGRASSGQSFVARRTYRGVRVRAKGKWTLTLTPLPAPKPKRR